MWGIEILMDPKDRIGSTKYFGSLHWFAIHTKPRDEYRVKNHFEGMERGESCSDYIRSFQRIKGGLSEKGIG
jgi:hypothetical protein